jgi:tetratricopeptide (TPR) repeat protein
MMAQRTAELVDGAERLRREGRIDGAIAAVEQVLKETPAAPRALLLKSRLFYQSGSLAGALDHLRAVEPTLGRGELAELRMLLEQLDSDLRPPPPFATESMARLQAQQGYFLEALEIYRQLFPGAANPNDLRDEIERLKDVVEREGSRDAAADRVSRELEICRRWLEEHPREA